MFKKQVALIQSKFEKLKENKILASTISTVINLETNSSAELFSHLQENNDISIGGFQISDIHNKIHHKYLKYFKNPNERSFIELLKEELFNEIAKDWATFEMDQRSRLFCVESSLSWFEQIERNTGNSKSEEVDAEDADAGVNTDFSQYSNSESSGSLITVPDAATPLLNKQPPESCCKKFWKTVFCYYCC